MKLFYKILVGIIIIILLTCQTEGNRNTSSGNHSEEKINSDIKFVAECYTCKPTVEELYYYSRIKNRESFSQKRIEPETLNIDSLRKAMIASNPSNQFIQNDFLNPWKEPASFFKSSGRRRLHPFTPSFNSGNRTGTMTTVKPGHQF